MRKLTFGTVVLLILIGFTACENPVPKPIGYYRIAVPEKEYKTLAEMPGCPYVFEYNTSAIWENDAKIPCWGDIVYPQLNARIQLTYKDIDNNLDTLIGEAHDLAYTHVVKADGIRSDFYTHPEEGVHGLLFSMQGDVATATQFFVTDSLDHFLRGVVYFYAPPNADSLRPLNEFMEGEVKHIMESLSWKN